MNTNRTRQFKVAQKTADALDARIVQVNTPSLRKLKAGGSYANALHISLANVDGMVALRDACHPVRFESGWRRGWAGDYRTAVVEGRGDEALAKLIQTRSAKLAVGVTTASSWELAPAGAYPIVPMAIGGDPFCMRRKTESAAETAPVRVYLPLSCSCAIKPEEFAGVMADCLAAIVAMSEVRPVELVGYGSLEGNAEMTDNYGNKSGIGAVFITVPIEYRFGDYAGLATWADVSLGRTVFFAICQDLGTGYEGQWPWSVPPVRMAAESGFAEYRMAMGLSDEDVLIPPLYGKDGIQVARKVMMDAAAACGITIDL